MRNSSSDTETADRLAVDTVWANVDVAIAPTHSRRAVASTTIVTVGTLLALSTGAVAYATYDSTKNAGEQLTRSESTQGTPETFLETQDRLTSVADDILALVYPSGETATGATAARASGFAGIKIDVAAGALDLTWVGDLPDNVVDVIQSHHDVEVRVHQSVLSAHDAQVGLLKLRAYFSSTSADPTFSLLEIAHASGALRVTIAAESDRADFENAKKELQAVAGVPIIVVMQAFGDRSLEAGDGIGHFAP